MPHVLPRRAAVTVFLAFAFAYFFSALARAITATLSPTLTHEFALDARDLGLLGGGYFLGFAATQLPLGAWLDRYGPRHVGSALLGLAVLGCMAFAAADSFAALLAARVLIGIGVSACLMAALTGYRRWLSPESLLRANSWMLMTGSLGMLASTLPVQWLLPQTGWRALFWGQAALMALALALLWRLVPRWQPATLAAGPQPGYAEVWRHRTFRKMVPIGFFSYGGLVAIQTLWATPWMTQVAGQSALQAATGLFGINLAMLLTFWAWGLFNPRLLARGWTPDRLIAWGLPSSFLLLAIIIIAGSAVGAWAGVLFALYFMGCSFVSLAQPAVSMAFPAALAGRALSAYNLVIFVGVFVVQWGIGLLVDGFLHLGWARVAAFQGALGLFLLGCLLSYGYFLLAKPDNHAQ